MRNKGVAPFTLITPHPDPRLVRLIHKAVNIPAGGIRPHSRAANQTVTQDLANRCEETRRARAPFLHGCARWSLAPLCAGWHKATHEHRVPHD